MQGNSFADECVPKRSLGTRDETLAIDSAFASKRAIAREFLDLLRQLVRLSLQRRHFLFQALDMPPHRLVEKLRGAGRSAVQLVIAALLERIARLQHADDFQLDALPQPAQLRDLALLAEVERRPSRSDACR